MASCNWRIAELPGLSKEQQTQLAAQGIRTTHQLLLATRTSQAKQQLARRLKIHPNYVFEMGGPGGSGESTEYWHTILRPSIAQWRGIGKSARPNTLFATPPKYYEVTGGEPPA